jgi:hypothetical protein
MALIARNDHLLKIPFVSSEMPVNKAKSHRLFRYSDGKERPMKKDKRMSLAELINGVMNHPDCPGELYDAMAHCLASLQSWSGSEDTKAWVEFSFDRYQEAEERGH